VRAEELGDLSEFGVAADEAGELGSSNRTMSVDRGSRLSR
jgi:hypothetical protein